LSESGGALFNFVKTSASHVNNNTKANNALSLAAAAAGIRENVLISSVNLSFQTNGILSKPVTTTTVATQLQ